MRLLQSNLWWGSGLKGCRISKLWSINIPALRGAILFGLHPLFYLVVILNKMSVGSIKAFYFPRVKSVYPLNMKSLVTNKLYLLLFQLDGPISCGEFDFVHAN